MMNIITSIANLTNTFIYGLNYCRNKKETLFYKLIEPVFLNFEKVHDNYLQSIKKYIEIVETSNNPININHPIFSELRRDSMFSSHLRNKILLFGNRTYFHKGKYQHFFHQIYEYLNKSYDTIHQNEFPVKEFNDISFEILQLYKSRNRTRMSIYKVFINISKEKTLNNVKKKKMIEHLESSASSLQIEYEFIYDSYHTQKIELF